MTHPISDPHGERVGHANEPQDKEDVDRLEEIAKELEVVGRGEEDGSDQLSLGRHKSCIPYRDIYK
jgi:hypothetical protein